MSLIPKKGTVYVVDDDEAVRDSLQWLLEGKDYRVRAGRGDAALQAASMLARRPTSSTRTAIWAAPPRRGPRGS